MTLKTKFVVIRPYIGKSKYEFWHNLQEDDEVTITHKLKSLVRGRSGLHSPHLTLTNHRDKSSIVCTYNEAMRMFEKISIQEISL
jgi:hypothetical protein